MNLTSQFLHSLVIQMKYIGFKVDLFYLFIYLCFVHEKKARIMLLCGLLRNVLKRAAKVLTFVKQFGFMGGTQELQLSMPLSQSNSNIDALLLYRIL